MTPVLLSHDWTHPSVLFFITVLPPSRRGKIRGWQEEVRLGKGNTCIARGTPDRPNELPEQIAAGRQGLQYYKGPAAPDIIASRYKTVKVPSIEELLDTLVAVGQARPTNDGRYVVQSLSYARMQALECCWHEPKPKVEAPMKMRLLFGGILIGGAIGILVGGAIVKVASDGSGKREYPQGLALLISLVGAIAVGSALREPANPPK